MCPLWSSIAVNPGTVAEVWQRLAESSSTMWQTLLAAGRDNQCCCKRQARTSSWPARCIKPGLFLEPSTRHVAMPATILLAILAVRIYWGWLREGGAFCYVLASCALAKRPPLSAATWCCLATSCKPQKASSWCGLRSRKQEPRRR